MRNDQEKKKRNSAHTTRVRWISILALLAIITLGFLPVLKGATTHRTGLPNSTSLGSVNPTISSMTPPTTPTPAHGGKVVSPLTLVKGTAWAGVSMDNPPNPCNCVPPDVAMGVGPSQVVQMSNTIGEFTDKFGHPIVD